MGKSTMSSKEILDLYTRKLPLAFLESAIVHCDLTIFTCVKFRDMENLTKGQIAVAFHPYTPNEPILRELIKSYREGVLHNKYVESFGLDDPNFIDVKGIYLEIAKIAEPYKFLLRRYSKVAEDSLMLLLIEGETLFY